MPKLRIGRLLLVAYLGLVALLVVKGPAYLFFAWLPPLIWLMPRPGRILVLLIFIAPYYQLPFISQQTFLNAKDVLLAFYGLSFVLLVLHTMPSKEPILIPETLASINRILLIFAIVVSFGLFSSKLSPEDIYIYLLYLLPITFYFSLQGLEVGRNERTIRILITAVVYGMVGQTIYILIRTFMSYIGNLSMPGLPPVRSGLSYRSTGFAASLALAIPISLGLAVEKYQNKSPGWLAWGFIFVAMVCVFPLSHGRAGILAAAIGLSVFLAYTSKKWLLVYSIALATIGGVLWKASRQAVLYYFKATEDLVRFAAGRIELYRHAIAAIGSNPLSGAGLSAAGSSAHNLVLNIGAQSGIPAAIVVLIFFAFLLRGGHSVVRHMRGTRFSYLAAALFAALITFMVDSFFESGVIFMDFYKNVPWWVCLVSLFSLPFTAAKQPKGAEQL